MHETNLTMAKLVNLGVCAILQKNITTKELVKAIIRVKEEGHYYNNLASRKLFLHLHDEEKKSSDLKLPLTEKEEKFLKLATTEMTYKQIAQLMKISKRAVDKIRNNLFVKLDVHNRVVLAIQAIRNALIPPTA